MCGRTIGRLENILSGHHCASRSWRGTSARSAASWRTSAACASRSSTSAQTGVRGAALPIHSTLHHNSRAPISNIACSLPASDRGRCALQPSRGAQSERRFEIGASQWCRERWCYMFLCCRPLSKELLEYAQTDVHYLCYLAGQLCAQLAARGPDCLQEASRRSHEMCLALYSKPTSEVRPPLSLSCARIVHQGSQEMCFACVPPLLSLTEHNTQRRQFGSGFMLDEVSICIWITGSQLRSHSERFADPADTLKAPVQAPCCMQAAVNAATTAVLRRAHAAAAQAHPQKDGSVSGMADCMYALCCWRDHRARMLDEGGARCVHSCSQSTT